MSKTGILKNCLGSSAKTRQSLSVYVAQKSVEGKDPGKNMRRVQ